MPFASVRGISLYHEVRGDGPRVLFISGTGSDLRRTPNVFDVPGIERLTICAYDHRLMGQSTITDGPLTMDDFADDALALLDHLGWDSCAVVGVSFGGMVAQHLAVRLGKRLTRLVLCCTSPGGEGGSSYPLHEMADLDAETFAERMLSLSDNRRDAAWRAKNPEEAKRMVDYYQTSARANREDPVKRAAQNRQLAARASHDAWNLLPGIPVPTLICAGMYDDIATTARAEAMRDRMPDATLREFEGGHLFFMEDRAAWPAIQEFLRAD
ncbi:MAG: alpha/beta fold hydrolase [Minwuia sp.]|nr:alpha/beta fold hydrolase [Minwuia sp.]